LKKADVSIPLSILQGKNSMYSKWLKRWGNEIDELGRINGMLAFVKLSGIEAIHESSQRTFQSLRTTRETARLPIHHRDQVDFVFFLGNHGEQLIHFCRFDLGAAGLFFHPAHDRHVMNSYLTSRSAVLAPAKHATIPLTTCARLSGFILPLRMETLWTLLHLSILARLPHHFDRMTL
jgi:hypothetical protein